VFELGEAVKQMKMFRIIKLLGGFMYGQNNIVLCRDSLYRQSLASLGDPMGKPMSNRIPRTKTEYFVTCDDENFKS
jgi:hypothetical protein